MIKIPPSDQAEARVSTKQDYTAEFLSLHAGNHLHEVAIAAFDLLSTIFPGPYQTAIVLARGDDLMGLLLCRGESEVREEHILWEWFKNSAGTLLNCESKPFFMRLSEFEDIPLAKGCVWPRIPDADRLVVFPCGGARLGVAAILLAGGPCLEQAFRRSRHLANLTGLHLRTALRRVLRAEESGRTQAALRAYASQACVGILTLDWNFNLLYSNRAAGELCHAWRGGDRTVKRDRARLVIPIELRDECFRLKQQHVSKDSDRQLSPAKAEVCPGVVSPDNPDLRGFVRLFRQSTPGLKVPFFQIVIGAVSTQAPVSSRGEQDSARDLLSPSEREVLSIAALGVSNEEIAGRLGKSLPTIKSQLQSIYRKLSISSRGELIARFSSHSKEKNPRKG